MRSLADVVEIKKGEDMKSKSTETKPSIVFCHGIWERVIDVIRAAAKAVQGAAYFD